MTDLHFVLDNCFTCGPKDLQVASIPPASNATDRTTFMSLPLETKVVIVSYLNQLSLKQLRLTCSGIKSIAERPLFRTLYGRPTGETVNMFLNVAGSSLRYLVQDFVWDNRAVCMASGFGRGALVQEADGQDLELYEFDPRLDDLMTDEDRVMVNSKIAEQVSVSRRLCEWAAFRGPAAVFFQSLKRKIPFRIEVPDRVDELLQYPISHLRDTSVLFRYATWATAGMVTPSLKPSYTLSEDDSAYPLCAAFETAWWVDRLKKIVVNDTLRHWSTTCEMFDLPSRSSRRFEECCIDLELHLAFDDSEEVDEQLEFEAEDLTRCMYCAGYNLCMHRHSSMQSTMNEQNAYFKRPLTIGVDFVHFHGVIHLIGCTLQWREWKEGIQRALDDARVLDIRIRDCRAIGLLKDSLLKMRFCLCDTEEFEGQDKSCWPGDASTVYIENVEDDQGESIWTWYDCKGEGVGCMLSGSQEQYQQYLKNAPARGPHDSYDGFRKWLSKGPC